MDRNLKFNILHRGYLSQFSDLQVFSCAVVKQKQMPTMPLQTWETVKSGGLRASSCIHRCIEVTRFLLKPQEQRLSSINYHLFTRLRPGVKRTGYYHLDVGGTPQQPAVFGNMPLTLASPSFRTHTVKQRLVQSDKTSLWCVTACHYQRFFGSFSALGQVPV